MPATKNIPFFFILGRPRSGTTLLRTMLDAHPEINIPFEGKIILFLEKKYNHAENMSPELMEQFVQDILLISKVRLWPMDLVKTRERLINLEEPSFKNVIKTIYLGFESVFDKSEILLLGDKNPHYSMVPEKIFQIFPEAKYIHLLRDYRDNILSVMNLNDFVHSVTYNALCWRFSYKKIAKLQKLFPGSFYSLNYEKLVNQPEIYMKSICHFLGIDYHENTISFYREKEKIFGKYPGLQNNPFYQNLFEPINSSAIGKWKNGLTAKQIRLADMIIGKYAEAAAYQRVYTRFGADVYILAIPGIIYFALTHFIISPFMELLPMKLKINIKNRNPLFGRLFSIFNKKSNAER